jgi:hypothetical protein
MGVNKSQVRKRLYIRLDCDTMQVSNFDKIPDVQKYCRDTHVKCCVKSNQSEFEKTILKTRETITAYMEECVTASINMARAA